MFLGTHRGEVVSIIHAKTQQEIARGLVNYSSDEVRLLCGTPSQQIESKLSYLAEEELIHKNNLGTPIHTPSNES